MRKHNPRESTDTWFRRELSDLRVAMCQAGLIMPTTADAFGAFKASVDAGGVEIPSELQAMRGPDSSRRFASQSMSAAMPFPLPPTAERLAQAAREGKEITEEVRERMRQDRRQAEK